MFLNCEKATHLISDEKDRPLTRRERIALRIHLILCTPCRRFKKNLAQLSSLLDSASDQLRGKVFATGAQLSPERRTRIKALLKRMSK
jgi:Putative zinc-finger